MARSTPPHRRAFGLSLPFNWFLFNDEEDLDWYIGWECERQDWWPEFDHLPHHIYHEVSSGKYGVYDGDVDQWFKEEQGYDSPAKYKDGEREFVIYFTVYIVESVLGKTIFECKGCKSHFTEGSLDNDGKCVLCAISKDGGE